MTIRTIQNTESMDVIWEELVYTEALLLRNPLARDQAPVFADLLARWEKISAGQRDVWRAEIVAQAAVDAEDGNLDGLVDQIDAGLQQVTGRDRTHPRYQRYFKRPPNVIERQGLESELATVRDWSKSLKSEPEPELQGLGKKLDKQIASGEKALAERGTAAAARADQRVRDVNAFIAAVNGARQAVYGALISRGQKETQPKTWAEGFFRKRPTTRPAAAAAPLAAAAS